MSMRRSIRSGVVRSGTAMMIVSAAAVSAARACPTGGFGICPPDCHDGSAAGSLGTDATPGPGRTTTLGLGSGGSLNGLGPAPVDVSIVDFAFAPDNLVIRPNTVVRWTNNGQFPHSSQRLNTWATPFLSSQQFADVTFDATRAGLAFDYECGVHAFMTATLTVVRFGDANMDQLVNLIDFNVLASNFNESGRTWETGDFNGDGNVNLLDFNLLATNFNEPINPAGLTLSLDTGTFVPEPTAATLLAAAGAVAAATRRRTMPSL